MHRFLGTQVCALLCGLIAPACYWSHERDGARQDAQRIQTGSDACVGVHSAASHVIPRVILLLDGSCSMSTTYPANGQASTAQCAENPNGRWAALRRALVDPQSGVVTKLQNLVQFGVVVFGTQPLCPIAIEPVKPALNNLSAIDAQLPNVPPGQFTPTGEALDWVFDNLTESSSPDTPQIVILATDGEPNNCGMRDDGNTQPAATNYQASIDAVLKGTAKGVTTYIISLADASGAFHDRLQDLANLGNPAANGQAPLYEPASPEQLAATLEGLLGVAVGCDIALPGAVDPGGACRGRVTLNDQAIACADPDGWKLLDARHVRLLGGACRQFMASHAKVDALFPCTSVAASASLAGRSGLR